MVRAAAVRGLQRFAADSAGARNALRAAAGDPSPLVRLNVLQRLDVEDAALIRALLAREDDPRVRTIARQLLELLEARGARLVRDAARRPAHVAGARARRRSSSIPPGATRWAGWRSAGCGWRSPDRPRWCRWRRRWRWWTSVVPAFFNVARTVVAYEAGGEIRVRDLRSGGTRIGGHRRGAAGDPVHRPHRLRARRGRTATSRWATRPR